MFRDRVTPPRKLDCLVNCLCLWTYILRKDSERRERDKQVNAPRIKEN